MLPQPFECEENFCLQVFTRDFIWSETPLKDAIPFVSAL